MSNMLLPNDLKATRPRIEAPTINSLEIGYMDAGVVWSGKLDIDPFTTPPDLADDITDDYASCGSVTIGCMGPKADVWVKDCPRLVITHDMRGEIRLPKLLSNETVSVGGGLQTLAYALTQPPFCGWEFTFGGFQVINPIPEPVTSPPFDLSTEDSPRSVWQLPLDWPGAEPADGIALHGRIILQADASLQGQIVLDANNGNAIQDPEQWKGSVVIGASTPALWTGATPPPSPIILSADPLVASFPAGDDADALAPLYRIPSHILGGLPSGQRAGAVGLVPFARYEADCSPENFFTAAEPVNSVIEQAAFAAGTASVEVAYYGPIYIDSPGSDGVDVLRVSFVSPGTFTSIPATWWRTSTPASRVLSIDADLSGGALLEGRYTLVELLATPSNRLECDVGLGLNGPPILETTRFDFALGDDCGIEVCLDNPFCFIADFDQSGGVDGDDAIAFFAAWDASLPSADVNFLNGVDGDDVIDFFAWWDNGGCGI